MPRNTPGGSLARYPVKYLETRRRDIIRSLSVVSVVGCGAGALSWVSVVGNVTPTVAAFATAFALVVALINVLGLRDYRQSSIYPYFTARISGRSDWPGHRALLRNGRAIDDAISAHGAKPLSFFGFADDLYGGTVVWHDPAEGIASIRIAEAVLPSMPISEDDRLLLGPIFRNVIDRLDRARKEQVQFCFIIRGGATNGLEQECRQGYL